MDVRMVAGTSNIFTLKVTPYQRLNVVVQPAGWMQVQRWFYNVLKRAHTQSLGLTTGEFKFETGQWLNYKLWRC
jgi:hypothetical protein